jgi:hypothetical protein
VFYNNTYSQTNLVPNPSFEDTVGCPSAAGEINKATGWATLCLSPDYYNACNQNIYDMGVPYNWAGYQNAASGNAYVGFATYSNSSLDAREFPACNLTTPLTIGTKYYISFKISLALTTMIQANYATDKIGAMFTMGAYTCNSLITNNPQVFTDSIITDSLNWTRISGSFIADSAYTYLVVGNFFDDANTDTLKFFNDFSDNAYYFLDDVCVSTDSTYTSNYNYTGIQENSPFNSIICYPNPIVENLQIQNSSNQVMDVDIYNVLGELLYSSHDVSEKVLSVDLGNANSEILFIKIKLGQQINTYKLLKL